MKYLSILLLACMALTAAGQAPPSYKDTVFTEYFRTTSGWTAADATISVPLPGGKTIWLMGDSHIDGYNAADTTLPCLFQVRNAMLVQDILEPEEAFTTVLDYSQTGVNRTPVKIPGDNSYFWPGHGYAKQDTAIVFWQRYSGNDYTHVGNYISKIYTPGFNDASGIKVFAERPLPAVFEFGTTVVVDSAKNFIYLYGIKPDWIVYRPVIARFPLYQDVFGPWEFFDGTTWTSDPNTSAQLMADTDHYVSPSYSVLKLQGKYYMISQDIGFLTCGLGREIYSWESDNPEGPFTNKKLLYTIEDQYRGEYMITYNTTAHPEFIKDNELLVSYNVNGACTNYCENAFTDRFNADLYRPKFIRVPLDHIDPALNVPDPVFPIVGPVTAVSPEEKRSPAVAINPNPAETGSFEISFANSAAVPATIEIKNIYGATVYKQVVQTTHTSVQIAEPGLYLVYIKTGTTRTMRKVVVL